MLKKLLSQKVVLGISEYCQCPVPKGVGTFMRIEGNVIDVDDNFIELDNGMIVAIKTITYIQTM